MDKFLSFIKQYRWTFLLVAGGLLLAVLLLTIGFWKTLLLLVILGICALLGYLLDQGGVEAVKSFFKVLFKGSGK